jgi:sugar lactone lactonase YvrE
LVFEPSGRFHAAWGHDRIADAHGISISPDDRVFLVDRDAHQILIFTIDGALLGTLGERHAPRFQAPFNHPTDAAVAPDGDIYVSDGYGNSAVHRFAPTGELKRTWGRPGAGPGEFSTPHAIWVDRSGRVLVADRENNRVPQAVEHWSLTTLREKLIKIGAKVVSHGRYVTFQLAEVAVPRELFRKILSPIDDLRRRPARALAG